MNEPEIISWSFVRNVLVKGILLFIIVNLLFAVVNPLPWLGRITLYNHLLPGRERLPYGDFPQKAYNLPLFQLDAMFASQAIDGVPKASNEYRLILIGDSATWGYLLKPDETLAAKINQEHITLADGKTVHAYNLGYPHMSLTKDLLILKHAMTYQPDMIVWLFTLESFPMDKQLSPPLLQHNPDEIRELITTYHLSSDPNDARLQEPTFWQRTLIGQRRTLANLTWLQVYGVMWAATGIDVDIPDKSVSRMEDLPGNTHFHHFTHHHLPADQLAWDVIQAGTKMAGDIPILLVNEPMFISQGKNSDRRYNFYYPRWAYDDYRQMLNKQCQHNGWHCLDLWNAIPASEFTNTAVHLTPYGSRLLAQALTPYLK